MTSMGDVPLVLGMEATRESEKKTVSTTQTRGNRRYLILSFFYMVQSGSTWNCTGLTVPSTVESELVAELKKGVADHFRSKTHLFRLQYNQNKTKLGLQNY